MNEIEEAVIEIIDGVIKQSIIRSEVYKDSEIVKALVEFAADYTGKEITKESKYCIHLLNELCKTDSFIAAYFFHRILLSNSPSFKL